MKLRSILFAVGMTLVPAGPGAAMAAEYLLAPSDVIRLRIRDWPDLSGEYALNPDGRISVPVIGEVPASGLAPAQLSQAISEAIQRKSGPGEVPVTAIEIVRFRPFFVLGDVQKPGEHAFRPGLTVLQAVSIAGGYYRPANSAILRTDRDIATATGDIDAQKLRRWKAMARSARLESGQSGKDAVAPPAELKDKAVNAQIARLIDNEAAIFALERRRAKDELRSLESIKALYQREIVSLQQQTEALKREGEAVQRQLSELRALAGRGLALTPNIITLERTLAQNQNEQLSMATAIVRARQNIEIAEQRARDQGVERRRQQAEELQQTGADIADAEVRIAMAEALVDEALTTERVEGRNPGAELMQRRVVQVVRVQTSGVREFVAEDGVILQPGDVLKVLPLPPRRLVVRSSELR